MKLHNPKKIFKKLIYNLADTLRARDKDEFINKLEGEFAYELEKYQDGQQIMEGSFVFHYLNAIGFWSNPIIRKKLSEQFPKLLKLKQ